MKSFSRFFCTGLSIFLTLPYLYAGTTVIMSTAGRGVLLSENAGNGWRSFSKGLPGRMIPLGIYCDSRGTFYLSTLDSGIFKCAPDRTEWIGISDRSFLTRSTTAPAGSFRKISAFAVDPLNPDNIAAATKHSIYMSSNGGISWHEIPPPPGSRQYITSLAFSKGKDEILAGTSFNGVYVLHKGGVVNRSNGFHREPYTESRYFYEEISALAADPGKRGTWYAGFNFGGGLYETRDSGRNWSRIILPETGNRHSGIHHLVVHEGSLYVSAGTSVLKFNLKERRWYAINVEPVRNTIRSGDPPQSMLIIDTGRAHPPLLVYLSNPISLAGKSSVAATRDKKGIYAGVPVVRKNLERLIGYIKRNGLNALTIDMKDDFGNVCFPARNPTAVETKALRNPLDIRSILTRLKKENIHSVARVVVFKDLRLYKGYGHKYAIWNGRTNTPWSGNTNEYWVDPHSVFVQEYNIALCRELEQLGFDEIQFDYIRFPSDGPVHQCLYRYRVNSGTYKSEVLADFLRRAKRALRIPVSVDIYGFNAWYRFGNSIGQDIEEFSRIVDAICPMVYPSHFGSRFYRNHAGDEHPYQIVYESGIRSLLLTGNTVVIRPYLQAFKMLSPTWGPGYIKAQIRGAVDSNNSGYTFWNAKGDYDMLNRALVK